MGHLLRQPSPCLVTWPSRVRRGTTSISRHVLDMCSGRQKQKARAIAHLDLPELAPRLIRRRSPSSSVTCRGRPSPSSCREFLQTKASLVDVMALDFSSVLAVRQIIIGLGASASRPWTWRRRRRASGASTEPARRAGKKEGRYTRMPFSGAYGEWGTAGSGNPPAESTPGGDLTGPLAKGACHAPTVRSPGSPH